MPAVTVLNALAALLFSLLAGIGWTAGALLVGRVLR
jgi:hypothetical protein